MAMFTCLRHRPKGPHYRSYARPLAWLEPPCRGEGCTQVVLVWLDPEEVRDYERGSRLFYDADYNTLRVDGSGLSIAGPAPLRLPRLNFRPAKALWPLGRKRERG